MKWFLKKMLGRHNLIHLSLWLLCLINAPLLHASVKPLPAEQAFKFHIVPAANQLILKWDIAPGYYLYREQMHIRLAPKEYLQRILFPEVKWHKSQNKKEAVYAGKPQFYLLLRSHSAQPLPIFNVTVQYQGCAKDGFCYPPMQKNIKMNLLTKDTQFADNKKETKTNFYSLLSDQMGVLALLQTQNQWLALLIFVGLGLLLAFTPCVLPMIPILTSIIIGQQQKTNTARAFSLSFAYVMGTAITYAFAGFLAAFLGTSLQTWLQKTPIIILMSGLFVLLAFSLFGLFDLRIPRAWHNRINQLTNLQQGGTYIGVFCMGILSTLIVSPCVTAPLVGVLLYISQQGSLIFGASALFALGIGMGIPLLLIGVSAGKWLPKSGEWMEVVKKLFGFMMLAMAIWLSSRVLSSELIFLAWSILLLLIALFFAIYLFSFMKGRGWPRSVRLLASVVSALLITLLIVPSLWKNSGNTANQTNATFVRIHNVNDFRQHLLAAQNAGQPVMLDFYADWCASCVDMDKKVFSKSTVQHQLSKYRLLRADLSANTAQDDSLLKYFAVIAPPTVLFFDNEGREINSQRIVGEVNENEFLIRLKKILGSSKALDHAKEMPQGE